MASARAPLALALALTLFALAATAVAAAAPTAAPYTIRTSTGVELVNVTDPLLNFTRHGWKRDDEVWTLATPFPVVFYGVEYNEIGVSSNANIQFNQTSLYVDDYDIDRFPYEYFPGALMAMQNDMSTDEHDEDDISSGVIGEAPNRIFVVDYQGSFLSNYQKVHFQFHLHEDSLTVSIVYGAGCNFLAPLIEPDDTDPFFVGVQQFRDTGLSTQYLGDLEESLRIDFETKPFVGFSGIPSAPLLIPRADIATLTLVHTVGVVVTAPTDFTLSCEAPTATALTVPLRLCPLTEGAEPCTSATDVEFRAADYSIDAEFVCTLTAAAPTDAVLLVAPFAVSIRLPRLAFGALPSKPLIVPTDSFELSLSPPADLQLPASINVTLTCTLTGAPTLTFDFSLCAEGDSACVWSTSAVFQTNAQMPSGDYSCVSTLATGSAASPLYNLAAPFAVAVVRPKASYQLTQSTASPFSTEGFTNHGWFGQYYNSPWTLDLPFPVRVHNGISSKVGVSASGNIQFSYPWGNGDWSSEYTPEQLPSPYFGTALFAYQTTMALSAVRSGVVGQAPNRVFVIDCQHTLNSASVRLQYLLHEQPFGSRLSVIYSGFPDIVQPWSNSQIAVALQSRDRVATIFDGTLTGTTRLDYNQYELGWSGVPTAPIRAPDGAAQITLVVPEGLEIAESADYTLTCASATAETRSFPLRLCARSDDGCVSMATVDISAAGVTAPVTFTCTAAFDGLSSLDYSLPAPFLVTLLPSVSVTDDWTLTVSRPAPFPARVFTNADAAQSPIELPVAAGPRVAVGSDAASLTHWMSGSNCRLDGNAPGHVEPNGAASDANTPGARMSATSWTGKDGQLYLFSGVGADSFDADLWRYSPVSGQWSLLPTPASTVPVYGIRGQPSNETTPGARENSCATVDDNGDAWLFGGHSSRSGALGDVFKRSAISGEWTFVAGSSTSSASPTMDQGMGVPIAGNLSGPGSRAYASCAWSNGKLFVFGGEDNGIHNDLWSYDPVADEWTWINGDRSTNVLSMRAHVMAVGADSTVTPPPRKAAFMAAAADGKLWLIGGADNNDVLADVWSFDLASGAWAFEAGSQSPVTSTEAVYGRIRVPAASNRMPGRRDFAAAIDKSAGVIFISGGLGTDNRNDAYLADVWSFNVNSKLFAFIGGTTAVNGGAMGAYPAVKGFDGGELRPTRPNNYAGNAWVDPSGGLWFGMGASQNFELRREQGCNDLWFMPSGAGVVTLDLVAAGFDSTVTSAEPSLTRLGRNRWTLGRPELDGTAKEFSFTIVGGTGVAAAPFTLRLLQRELFTDNSWSVAVAAPGLTNPVALTQASPAEAGLIALPADAADATATITISLPEGATVSPAAGAGGVFSVPLGARGSSASLTFTVTAENGVAAAPFTITFSVAQFSDNSWSAVVAAIGLTDPVALTQASDAAAGLIQLPAESALATATITLTLPTGATVSPAATNGVLSVTLGAAGTNRSLTFTVSAESGAAAAPFTVTFAVAAPPPQPAPESSSTGESGAEGSSSTGESGADGQSSTGQSGPEGSSGSDAGSSSSGSDSPAGSSTGAAPTDSSSTGPAPTPVSSSTGLAPTPRSSSTGGSSPTPTPVATFKNATVTMQLNFTAATLPATLVADIKAGITAATGFPSRVGQMLLALLRFVSGGGALRRRLLASGAEVAELELIFVPADDSDAGAFNVSTALGAQLSCATPACAAAAAAAAGFGNIFEQPALAQMAAALVPGSLKVEAGKVPAVDPAPGPGPAPADGDDDGDDGSSLTNGAVAAIVIGVVVGTALLAGAAFMVVQAQRAKSRSVGGNARLQEPQTELTAV